MKYCIKCHKTYDDRVDLCVNCKTKLEEFKINGTELSQIMCISITPLPNFCKKIVKEKGAYDDTLIERFLKKEFSVRYKLEQLDNAFCSAKIWVYEKGVLKDYDEIEDANSNPYNPFTFYNYRFADLYSDEEKKGMDGNASLDESLAFSYSFRTNEVLLHLDGGRFSTIDSLIVREIALNSILFRLDISDLKSLEKYHMKSFSPADIDYYTPTKHHRKYHDLENKKFVWWTLDVFDFTDTMLPAMKDDKDIPKKDDAEKEKYKINQYASEEVRKIGKLSEQQNYGEAYERIISLENIMNHYGLDISSILSLKKVLTAFYAGVLFNAGNPHISNKEWVPATIKHLITKDFILKNLALLDLDYDVVANFMSNVEKDIKNRKDFADVKSIREKYHAEITAKFNEMQGGTMQILVDVSITPLLADYAIFGS